MTPLADAFGINPTINTGSSQRKVLTILAIVVLGVIARPSVVPATLSSKSESRQSDAAASSGQRVATFSVIPPPPDETPQGPPPGPEMLNDYSPDTLAQDSRALLSPHSSGGQTSCAGCVLELPRRLRFQRHPNRSTPES